MQTFTYREGPRAQPSRHPARRKDPRAQPSPHPERSGKSFDRSIAAPRTHLPRPMAVADGGWLRRGGAGGARVRARAWGGERAARAGRRARGARTEGPAQSPSTPPLPIVHPHNPPPFSFPSLLTPLLPSSLPLSRPLSPALSSPSHSLSPPLALCPLPSPPLPSSV